MPHVWDLAAQYRILMAQDQQLSVFGQITAEQHDQQAEYGADDHVDEGEEHLRWSQAERHGRSRTAGQTTNRIFERDRPRRGCAHDVAQDTGGRRRA